MRQVGARRCTAWGTVHTRLQNTVIRPLLKVHAPAGKGASGFDRAGQQVLLVDSTWFTNELSTLTKLPVSC